MEACFYPGASTGLGTVAGPEKWGMLMKLLADTIFRRD
jgi:hypothetical protein